MDVALEKELRNVEQASSFLGSLHFKYPKVNVRGDTPGHAYKPGLWTDRVMGDLAFERFLVWIEKQKSSEGTRPHNPVPYNQRQRKYPIGTPCSSCGAVPIEARGFCKPCYVEDYERRREPRRKVFSEKT